MMKRTFFAVIFISLSACIFAVREPARGTITFSEKGLSLMNIDTRKDASGAVSFRMRDTSYSRNDAPLITDMILSFNSKQTRNGMDDSRRYPIIKSQYEPSDIDGSNGGGSALFYRSKDGIELSPKSNLWLSSHKDLGSFTIEMRVKPLSLNDGSVLFSRIGYSSGTKNGIEIIISRGKITAHLYDMFQDESGILHSSVLEKGPRLKEGNWYHYALSFERKSGKLCQFIDGTEADVRFMTAGGEAKEGVYSPVFAGGDAPRIAFGSSFRGYLDECRITYRSYENLRQMNDTAERRYCDLRMSGRTPINREGVITSPVSQFKYTGTMVSLFSWQEHLEKDSYAYVEFRTSDVLFDADDTSLQWYRIANNQRGIYQQKTRDGFLRGKYYQWRARLVAAPEGNAAPEISNISLNYELDLPPEAPIFVKAQAENNSVRLTWRKNVDFDFYGYRIYYGVRPGKYDGVIRRIGSRAITNDFSRGDNVSVEINNNVIDENRSIDSGSVLEYPVLKNNIIYYFSVSAYDSYKVDTRFNHESKYSEEVSARPVPSSDIVY